MPPSPRVTGTRVAQSPTHGRGLFAERRFERGEKIGVFQGPATTRDGTHVLWVEDENGIYRGTRATNDLRFMNHAPRPNAEVLGLEVHAVRVIRSGEEITIHYGDDWNDLD